MRAPCRADCGRPMPYVRALHRREASLFRRATVVRRASAAGFARHARARHCAGCLRGGGTARELPARARRAALVVVGLCLILGHCTAKRPLSFCARPWYDVPAQPAFAWHARARHCAGCLSGGSAARELSAPGIDYGIMKYARYLGFRSPPALHAQCPDSRCAS